MEQLEANSVVFVLIELSLLGTKIKAQRPVSGSLSFSSSDAGPGPVLIPFTFGPGPRSATGQFWGTDLDVISLCWAYPGAQWLDCGAELSFGPVTN